MPKLGRMTMGLRTRIHALGATSLALLALSAGVAEARVHRPSTVPVVVELYTAQGCSTCPQANKVIGDLEAKKNVLPLTFSVDYWDYLGWEDTLAKAEFTARQRAYAERLKVREIYTPEIVVQGGAEAPALEQAKIDTLMGDAEAARRQGPRIHFSRRGARVSLSGLSPLPRTDVWLVRYDPQPVVVKIKAGENKGQTVTVRNAVRELIRLGTWRGAAKTYVAPPAEDEGLTTVVLVQGPKGGAIFAAAKG